MKFPIKLIIRLCNFALILTASCILKEEDFHQPKLQLRDYTNKGPHSFQANWVELRGVEKFTLTVEDLDKEDGDSLIRRTIDSIPGNAVSYVVTNLQVNRRYRYRVGAMFVNGKQEFSRWAEVKTEAFLMAPIAKKAINRTPLEFTAVWEKVEGINTYLIRVATDRRMQNIVYETTVEVISPRHTIQLTDFESKYFYHIASQNGVNQSSFSDTIEVEEGVKMGCRLSSLYMVNDSQNEYEQKFLYDAKGRLQKVINKVERGGFLALAIPGSGPTRSEPRKEWIPDYTSAFYQRPSDFIRNVFPNTYTPSHEWTLSYDNESKGITEARLTIEGKEVQVRKFFYTPVGEYDNPTSVTVQLFYIKDNNNTLLRNWKFEFDRIGRVVKWIETDVNEKITPHAIFDKSEVAFQYDNLNRMVKVQKIGSTNNLNAVFYEYDQKTLSFNPIALLKNPLYSMFVLVPRTYIEGPWVFGESNVGFNMFLPISNIVRQQSFTTLSDYVGKVLLFNPIINSKTFAVQLEGSPSFREIKFEGCD